jgi:hypothetical protein
MKMAAEKAKSENMEKTSMNLSMKQLRRLPPEQYESSRRTANTLRRGVPAVCLARQPVRNTG